MEEWHFFCKTGANKAGCSRHSAPLCTANTSQYASPVAKSVGAPIRNSSTPYTICARRRGTAPCLQEVMLDGVDNDLLHLAKVHEGHQISQGWDLHDAVDMTQLLQQPQDSYSLQRLAVLLQRHFLHWAGPCRHGWIVVGPMHRKACYPDYGDTNPDG